MIFDLEHETMGGAERDALQLERLRALVARLAETVPLYRERLGPTGVDVRALDDLARLPFTTKEDLRAAYPFGVLGVPRERCVRVHASSGTTGGRPTLVGYTPADVDLFASVNARALCCAGAEPGQVLQNAYGYGLFTGGLGLHYGGERLGVTVVPVSSGNTARQVNLIEDLRPEGITITPSFALVVADALDARGVGPAEVSLRWGIMGAEPWSESMRAEIEARLGCDAVDIYGLSEVVGPGVACECREAKAGLHVNEDHFLVEVVDPASGEPLGPGTVGELVFTTLTREASPVLRYRTGDVASLDDGPCRCGRTLRRMSRVKGRTDDMLVVRGVNLFPSEVEQVLIAVEGLAPHYRMVVEGAAGREDYAVEVELDEALAAGLGDGALDSSRVAELSGRAADALKAALGVRLGVTVVAPHAVPRSEGKAVRVVHR